MTDLIFINLHKNDPTVAPFILFWFSLHWGNLFCSRDCLLRGTLYAVALLRYAISCSLSFFFLSPAKTIFVPGMYFLGFSRYSKRVSWPQVMPAKNDENEILGSYLSNVFNWAQSYDKTFSYRYYCSVTPSCYLIFIQFPSF